ncbi:MAG TPA: hypothetical protein VEF05_17390 [Terriglobales bacterium]|nr:hypothetical protein [Terriglobales bacterium]
MNLKRLTVLADVLILLGLVLLWTGWQGSANLTGAFPFHSSSVSLTGSASGFHALIGFPSLLIGLILMVISLVWTVFEMVQR